MSHVISIDAAATNLNRHVVQYAPEVAQQFRVGLEFENMVPFVQADKIYTAPNATMSDLVQPYQPRFTPNNTESWDAVDNELVPIKMDLEFNEEQLMTLYDKWAVQYAEAGKEQLEMTYYKYVIENLVTPVYHDNMNQLSWNGVYNAPTAGTPGAVLDSCDGFKVKIAAAITAGKLTPVPSGSFTSSDIRSKLEDWMKAMPAAVRGRGGVVYMSDTNARNYYYDFRGDFSTATWSNLQAAGGMTIDGFPVKVVGVKAMEGSNRWIFVPAGKQNMICGTRRGYAREPQFIFDADLYTLRAKAVIYRFYGFEYWANLYVNDQA